MLNVAPQKERISDHLRAMAEQDDKSAASGKTGEKSTIGVGCAPGEERGAAIDICAIHSPTVTAAVAEYCEDWCRDSSKVCNSAGGNAAAVWAALPVARSCGHSTTRL